MRIVLFPSAYAPAVGGVEELTRQLVEHLTFAGDQVEVWTNRHPAALPERETIGGALVRRFDLPLPRMDLLELTRFPMTAALAYRRLEHAVRKTLPDVVHVQCFSSNGVYGAAVTARLQTPFVVTLQGETVMDDHDVYDRSRVLPAALRRSLRRATCVTACSHFVLGDAHRRFGLPEGAGCVIPNGVDLTSREPHIAMTLPFQRFVFALGRVVDKKGFDLLLQAFDRIAVEHPDVGLVIGGDGAAKPQLAALVQRFELNSRVMLPGTLSRGEVAWAMDNASVFVLPSRVEPFGIVVLEALRAGVPTVVSSRGGASEIVRHDREGLVVDPHNVGELAAAITRLLSEEKLRQRLAVAAVDRAKDFAWEGIAEQYRMTYRRAIEGSGRHIPPLPSTGP